MVSVDIVISSGMVLTPSGLIDAEVAISDGKIRSISRSDRFNDAGRKINARGKVVLPGVIDPHVHIYSEGSNRTFEQNLRLETPSMIRGGVTTAFGFVASLYSYHKILPLMVEQTQAISALNMGFHLVLNNDLQLAEIREYHDRYGINSFKLFMGEKGVEIFPGRLTVDDGFLLDSLREIASLDRSSLAIIHAENWQLINRLKEKLQKEGRKDAKAWTESRPGIGEEEAVRRAAFFAREASCNIYVAHVSSSRTLSALRWAVESGVNIRSEVTPHNLVLSDEDHSDLGPMKFTPPVRGKLEAELLWSALRSDEINCVGSDHLAGKTKKDLPPPDNIWTGSTSYPGSGLILPLLFTEGYLARHLTLERLVEVTSSSPAKILSLYPRKGVLVEGDDADLVLVDPEREEVVTPEKVGVSSDFTPYDGRKLKGWPTVTILGGEIAFENGVEVAGVRGRYISQREACI